MDWVNTEEIVQSKITVFEGHQWASIDCIGCGTIS
jgi:hypothetical protein